MCPLDAYHSVIIIVFVLGLRCRSMPWIEYFMFISFHLTLKVLYVFSLLHWCSRMSSAMHVVQVQIKFDQIHTSGSRIQCESSILYVLNQC